MAPASARLAWAAAAATLFAMCAQAREDANSEGGSWPWPDQSDADAPASGELAAGRRGVSQRSLMLANVALGYAPPQAPAQDRQPTALAEEESDDDSTPVPPRRKAGEPDPILGRLTQLQMNLKSMHG